MVRTQITLTEEQMTRLRDLARRQDRSLASVVRDAVDRVLSEDENAAHIGRALEAIEEFAGDSGQSDVARNHDVYLADAWGR